MIAELTAGHREVEALFAQIEAQPVGDQRRRELADEVTSELLRRTATDEQVLYPAVRKHITGGDELAGEELAGHARVTLLLKDLEGCAADDPQFDHLLARLRLDVRAHVHDQQERLFPSCQ